MEASAGLTFFDIFERAITVLTPIILAIIALRQTKASKKVEDFTKTQSELVKAKEEIEKRDKEELDNHFKEIQRSIDDMKGQFERMDKTVTNLNNLQKQLSGLIELSSANMELCQSLSNVVSSIGDALDSTDSINSADLKKQLNDHHKKEQDITNRILKIAY